MNAALGRPQSGFSLIELLVVVFIIGIIIGFATLSLGGRALDDRLQEEARRLERIFSLAAEESLLSGQQIGWLYADGGYRFLVLGPDAWLPYGDGSPLRPRTLPEPIQLDVLVEDLPLPSNPERATPQVVFLSSGELTPFEVRVTAPAVAAKFVLQGIVTGAISARREVSDQ